MARCEKCIHWDIANAEVAVERLPVRHDANWKIIKPPHADLNWAECAGAKKGFSARDSEEEAALYGGKMAVFDGSEYIAELWTRFDHICGMFQPRPTGTK